MSSVSQLGMISVLDLVTPGVTLVASQLARKQQGSNDPVQRIARHTLKLMLGVILAMGAYKLSSMEHVQLVESFDRRFVEKAQGCLMLPDYNPLYLFTRICTENFFLLLPSNQKEVLSTINLMAAFYVAFSPFYPKKHLPSSR